MRTEEREIWGVWDLFSLNWNLGVEFSQLFLELLDQANLSQHHFRIHCLTHIVEGQSSHSYGGQGFHFNAGRPTATDRAPDLEG